MRRADRLFQIVQSLRGGRLVRARDLAEKLGVSERSIYRDMRDLLLSGVPVDGEPGVGYVLRRGFDLPPLMFTAAELTALRLGAEMVAASGPPNLAEAAGEALVKIEAVLPPALKQRGQARALFVPPFAGVDPASRARLDLLHRAIDDREIVATAYTKLDGETSRRRLWPLGLFFWGKVWTLGAWCALRDDFRNFRVDRLDDLSGTGERFPDMPGRRLADFLRAVRAEADCPAPYADSTGRGRPCSSTAT